MNYLEKEKEEIIKELLDSGKIKPDQLINYSYFLELYIPYIDKMKESAFAEILGISYGSYMHLKNEGKRAIVLKNMQGLLESNERRTKKSQDKQAELSEEEAKIIETLLASKKVEEGQSIDYSYFLELHEPYKEKMQEKQFANILGIKSGNYRRLKNSGTRARVLKRITAKLGEEERTKIIEELLDNGKISPGQMINYSYFLELYKPYIDKMKESDFAKILGISYCAYENIKCQRKRNTKVYDYRDKEKIDRIRYILEKETRYYSKEEIEEIGKKYGINTNTMIKYIICAGDEEGAENHEKILEEKGKIWIGDTECSKGFASIHSKTIIQKAAKTSKDLCLKYRCKHMEQDIAGDAIVYVLQKCGDIDKNFYDKEEAAEELIKARMYMFIKYRCLTNLGKPKQYYFYGKYSYKGDKNERNVFDRGIEDKTENVQNEVEEKILEEIKRKKEKNPEEACIELLKMHIESGLDKEEAITRTGQVLGVNPEVMVETIKTYMIKQNSVRQTKDGGFVLGE